jgi:hypothetical protein
MGAGEGGSLSFAPFRNRKASSCGLGRGCPALQPQEMGLAAMAAIRVAAPSETAQYGTVLSCPLEASPPFS